MAENIAQLGVEVKPSGIHETTSQLERLSQVASNAVSSTKHLTESFGNVALKIAGYSTAMNLGIDMTRRAIREIGELAKESVVLAASFERSRVAWSVFLKDTEMGNEMFGKLYSLAQRTPLSFQGVEEAAQKLKGFGLATNEIIPTLERMGDVARGNDETMQRLALAYGQALAQGRVLTRDLYQFVNAGVPIFDALAVTMGKSVEQVQALVTDGKVGFPEIEKALKALTDKGGQFYEMMEKTAQTTEGKWSIAMDNWRAILADIGTSVLPGLNKALDEFNKKADYTIQKNNLSRAMTGQGGDKQAALAFAQAELAQMVPGNQSPERFLLERAVSELQSEILESRRMGGSYVGPTKWVGAKPASAKDDWRISLMDVTGIDATGYRLNANDKWELPSADLVVSEYIDSLASKYTPEIVAKRLEETYKTLLTKPGKFESSDNTMIALQKAIDKYSSSQYTPTPVYTDRYMYAPGGGVPYLTPEEYAQTVWSERVSTTDSARFAGRYSMSDPTYMNFYLKYGMSPESYGEMVNAGFAGSPELADESRWALLNSMGVAHGASTSPSDPFWFYEMLGLDKTPMNGGVVSASNYPESAAYTPDRWQRMNDMYRAEASRTGEYWRTEPYSTTTTFQTKEQAESARIVADAWNAVADAMLRATSKEIISGFESIGEALAGGENAAQSFEDATAQIVKSLADQLPLMMLEAGLRGVILNPSNPVAWALIAAGLGGAVAWGAAQGAVSQSTTSTLEPNALGNIYQSRSLKQYENGVYNTPQYFAFAKGGVFGEAGYEAIMPLARSASGALGVRAQAASVNVVINNNAGASVTAEETTDENGERKIMVTVEKMVKGMVASGKIDGVMAGRYGTRVMGAQRM